MTALLVLVVQNWLKNILICRANLECRVKIMASCQMKSVKFFSRVFKSISMQLVMAVTVKRFISLEITLRKILNYKNYATASNMPKWFILMILNFMMNWISSRRFNHHLLPKIKFGPLIELVKNVLRVPMLGGHSDAIMCRLPLVRT